MVRHSISNAEKIGTAFFGIVMLAELLRPRNNTAAIINSMGNSFSMVVNAATGGELYDPRTPADRFTEDAMTAIGDFWRGFGDDL